MSYESARLQADRIRRRERSAAETLDAFLARVEAYDKDLNAVVSIDADLAREAARAADATPADGPLHGVPMTIKDGYDVAGLRTTVGTPVFDRTPDEDGVVAARLRAAGAIIVGHTNVPPFLMDYHSENEVFGRTNNPWDRSRTPGGSSGGAAAALAAGLTPIEVGSDLAGSLRVPPHFCGVYGLKATEYRISSVGFFRPLDGVPRTVRVLGSLGPMARDLDDLDLVLRVISGPDAREPDVPPVPLPPRTRRSPADLRLAFGLALPGAAPTAELRDAVSRVAGAASDAGARVVEALPEVDWGLQEHFMDLVMAATSIFDPGADLTPEQRGLATYMHGLEARDRFTAAFTAFFADHDALVLPPANTVAFPHGTDSTGEGMMCAFANLAGLPVLTVPAGRTADGLPVGVQLVGPRWSEMRLLDVAAALEEAGVLPGFTPPPGY
jgi:amidase